MDKMVLHSGGCHCGKVAFEFKGPKHLSALDCNCSICCKLGYIHVIVPKIKFLLLKGEEMIKEYTFNTRMATHMFCKQCGIKSFYIPRSHPTCYSVNARCLNPDTWDFINITKFDGLNWETAKAKLKE
ncbi:MAG: GFA family protein [Pseudomonadota bacterium]|nr:GFA family protein [Pseudomonadota bacterium]